MTAAFCFEDLDSASRMGVAIVTVLASTPDGLGVLILFGVGVSEHRFKSDDLFKGFLCC